MATGTVATGYDAEVAQYMARQKRTADQDRGAADAADADAYKKLMGKFGNPGVSVGDKAAGGLGAGDPKISSNIGLDQPVAASAAAPAPAAPAAPSSPGLEPPKQENPPAPPAPPPPPKKKKKKKKSCLKKTFGVIGKIVKAAVPAVVGFFTGGPVGAVMGAVQGISSVVQKKPA
jgi:hypothetical protein